PGRARRRYDPCCAALFAASVKTQASVWPYRRRAWGAQVWAAGLLNGASPAKMGDDGRRDRPDRRRARAGRLLAGGGRRHGRGGSELHGLCRSETTGARAPAAAKNTAKAQAPAPAPTRAGGTSPPTG